LSNKLTAAVALLLLFASVSPVLAESEGETAVHELISLSGAQKQYGQMLVIMARSMREGFNRGLIKALENKPIAPEKRKEAAKILQKHFNDFMAQYESHLRETMTWEALVKDIYTPLYLKHFTLEEINNIIAFYKSPTGQKFSQKSPQLIAEASQSINATYGQQLNDFAANLSQKKISQAIEELKPLEAKQKK
jgi:hypothetical protein